MESPFFQGLHKPIGGDLVGRRVTDENLAHFRLGPARVFTMS